MRDEADLIGERRAAYRERKRQIAITRVSIVNALMSARAAEDHGEIVSSHRYAFLAQLLCEDLAALLEEWCAEYPPGGDPPGSGLGST